MNKKLICESIVAVMMLSVTAMQSQAAIIGHWKLDDGSGSVVDDSSVNDRDGVLNSGTWKSTVPPAKVGGAIEFTSSGDGVSVNMGAGVLPSGNAERTITAWVRSDASSDKKFFGYGGSGAGRTFDWVVEGTGIWLRHGGGQVKWDFGYTLGTMMHVAIVVPIDAANVGDVKLYIDGSEQAAPNINNNSVLDTTAATSFYIGRGFSSAAFDGIVDDVQFYDTALSDQDISSLAANPGATVPEPATMTLLALGGLAMLRRRRK
ncbi:MAG: LamG domain-containing protein [Phycisphaerales bacterium]|nr:LamG domain-containing protein [Phycisphaerales bacterium]